MVQKDIDFEVVGGRPIALRAVGSDGKTYTIKVTLAVLSLHERTEERTLSGHPVFEVHGGIQLEALVEEL